MYCDTYCKGRSSAVDCASFTGDEKEKCIKSCLDCRSPNKKFCYCPTIFPPPVAPRSANRLGGRSFTRMHDDIGLLSIEDDLEDEHDFDLSTSAALPRMGEEKQFEEDEKSDTGFIVGIVAFVIIVAIAVAVFCVMRYNRRKHGAAGSSGPMSKEQPMEQTQMQQGSRGGSRPQSSRYENPRSRRRSAEPNQETDDD